MPTFEVTDRMLLAELVGARSQGVKECLYLSIYYVFPQER